RLVAVEDDIPSAERVDDELVVTVIGMPAAKCEDGAGDDKGPVVGPVNCDVGPTARCGVERDDVEVCRALDQEVVAQADDGDDGGGNVAFGDERVGHAGVGLAREAAPGVAADVNYIPSYAIDADSRGRGWKTVVVPGAKLVRPHGIPQLVVLAHERIASRETALS